MKQKGSIKRVALMGLLFALAVALSWLESMIPSFGLPGVKLGLSNTVTMYCLFFLGPLSAFSLALLKAGFVLLTRGGIAALMSVAGGVVSVVAMLLVRGLKASRGMVSVTGALAHNIAQLCMSALILRSGYTLYYLPVLVISGVGMGLVTAMVLRLVLPALERLQLHP